MSVKFRWEAIQMVADLINSCDTSIATFHLPLNLMTPIPRNVLTGVYASKQLELLPLDEIYASGSAYTPFRDIFDKLKTKLYVDGQSRKKVFRIVVYELGGPDWGDTATSIVSPRPDLWVRVRVTDHL